MKNKLLIIALIAIVFINKIHAQDYATGQKHYNNYVGVGAGFTTGYGFSYRYIPENFGAMVNFAPYYQKDDNSTVSFGITLLQRLRESKDAGLYFYFANSVFYKKEYTPASGYGTYPGQRYVKTNSTYNTGLGLDLQLYTGTSPIVVDLMGGFGGYDSFQTITVTAEFAFYYRL